MRDRILVTGAGGTVGRALVPLLVEAGALVRAGLHDLRSDSFEGVAGVEPVPLDFDEPASLAAAFARVHAVYLLTPQTPDSVRYVRAALDAAGTAGVQHVVRQSVYNAETGLDGIARWHREAEGLIRISGLRHTFLRPNSFMQNFLTIYRKRILQDGFFSLPLGRAALSSIDVRDIAAAAAAALTTDEADREAFVLTGPEALTGRTVRGDPEPRDRPPHRLSRRAGRRGAAAADRGRARREPRAPGDEPGDARRRAGAR